MSHDHDSDFGHLLDKAALDATVPMERIVQVLLAHARHTSEKLNSAAHTLDGLTTAVKELTDQVKQHHTELQKNTEITSAIKETVNAGKIVHKVAKGLAALLITCAMLWGAWVSISTGTVPSVDAAP
jgi:DNA anti-recombination protein RmuC